MLRSCSVREHVHCDSITVIRFPAASKFQSELTGPDRANSHEIETLEPDGTLSRALTR